MKQTMRTTIALPEDLLAAANQAVHDGKARSRNELIANALRHELASLRKAEIDEAFVVMADDREFQEHAGKIAREFADSDWEAFRQGEQPR